MALRRTLADLAEDARSTVDEIDPDELMALLEDDRTPLVIDVREREERARGAVPGSVGLPRGILERDLERVVFEGRASASDLDRPIVLYCGGGHRSLLAARSLQQMGFTAVSSLAGGFGAWGEAGGAVELDRRRE